MITLKGKVSWFGGPTDMGVSPSEGLAFIYDIDDAPHLFLPSQPPNTTGLARRLDADNVHYIALRWDYNVTSKETLLDQTVSVTNTKTGKTIKGVYAADWGPHVDTDRIADISPKLMADLDLTTDDEVIVEYEPAGVTSMTYQSIVISSGHSTKCQGAVGILNEVKEATKVVDRVAVLLAERGVDVVTYHDTKSTSQNENLNRIVDAHNAENRDLDVSVHFNAYVETTKPMGVECLFLTQSALAGQVSAAIAEEGGFINRGAKKRTDLFFLNSTEMPSILIETCFVDSTVDAELYEDNFEAICEAIASVLGGEALETETPPGEERPPIQTRPPAAPATVRIDFEVSGDVMIIVNGVPIS